MKSKVALLLVSLVVCGSAPAMAEQKTYTSTVMNSSASPSSGTLQFKGISCIKDCITQKRGYDWAQRNNVKDADGCKPLNLQPARDGCAAYLNEQKSAQPEDAPAEAEGVK